MSDKDDNTEDDENVFYFESDHLAIRGNQDYTNTLRVIAVLEAQKIRVHKQIEELILTKNHYLNNTKEFLNKVQNGEELIKLNSNVVIPQLPQIGHYDDLKLNDVNSIVQENNLQTKNYFETVRGRVVTDDKPESYNQLWTVEEQKRLEELLLKYPEERIEMHRFSKIAKELGNRTALQVSSRVQKYFQKLHSAGLPVPGRIPKSRRCPQVKFKHFYRPSTFFPSHNVPVQMPEDDFNDICNPVSNDSSTSQTKERFQCDHTDENGIKIENMSYEVQEQILYILKIIKKEKQSITEGYNPDPLAAKCAACQISTVSQSNWRCNTCYCHLNLCTDCLTHQLIEQEFEHFTHDVVAENDT